MTTITPICPLHKVEMVKETITQGEKILCVIWGCPMDDCDEFFECAEKKQKAKKNEAELRIDGQ